MSHSSPAGVVVGQHAEVRIFVGLGGNLGDRLATLRAAVRALAGDVPHTRVLAASPIYETRPVGPSTEPFFNAVVELRTRLSPLELLEQMLTIEACHGRQRRRRWDARTLDLDLLLVLRPVAEGWEAVDVDGERLRVPHPRMTERDFVLVPLADLVGTEILLSGQPLRGWLGGLDEGARTVLRRVEEGLLEAEP